MNDTEFNDLCTKIESLMNQKTKNEFKKILDSSESDENKTLLKISFVVGWLTGAMDDLMKYVEGRKQ